MRAPSTLLLVATLLLAGCVAPAALDPQGTPDALLDGAFSARVFEPGFVFGFLSAEVDPTLTIHAETFLPLADKPLAEGAPATFPTILVMSPYFGAGQGGSRPGHPVYGWLVDELVPRGYAVVFADTAGTGGSSGCWDFMGPNEVRGVAAMIETIAQQPWSDGNVGMIGKSYDGMTQIMGATSAPAALKTIVPVAPLTHAYAGLYQNGVHYGGGWHLTTTLYHQISATPPVGAEERYPGYAVRTIETPPCLAQNTALGNDPSGAYNPYFQARDFRPKAPDVTASVFFIQGFLDPAVKPDNMFPFFNDLPGQRKAWLGQWEHDYPNANLSGREDMFLTLHRWFDHELKGIENGIDTETAIDVQDSLGRWRRESAWPPTDAAPLALYPTADGALADAAATGSATFGGPRALTSAVGDLAGAVEFAWPVTARTHVAGLPALDLTVASDRPGGYVVARLFDVNESGARLVSQGAMNLQLAADPTLPTPVVPTMPVSFTLTMYPTDYVLEPGHTLVLRLQTTDERGWYDPDATTATMTLDLAKSALQLGTIERSDDAFFLTACGQRIADEMPSCYAEGRVDQVVG